jgi:hypothetical protein
LSRPLRKGLELTKEVEPVEKLNIMTNGRNFRDAVMSLAGSTSGAVHLK